MVKIEECALDKVYEGSLPTIIVYRTNTLGETNPVKPFYQIRQGFEAA